jgi:hypothetical protein
MAELEDLRESSAALARLDERRAGQVAYRDELVRKALSNGATWPQVMDAAGLSRRGVQQAIRRQA